MLNIKDHYILEIAKEKSFTSASENLFISQPALSKYIIGLEKELDISIFNRNVSPIEITEEGKILLEYIYHNNELEKEFFRRIDKLKQEKSSMLKIGIVPWRMPVFLPNIIPEFTKNNPDIDVSFIEDLSPNLEKYILNDDLDIAIINGPLENASLAFQELTFENIILIVNKKAKFLKDYYNHNQNKYIKKEIDICKLKNEKFIVLKDDFRLGKISREIFNHYNIKPQNILEVSNLSSAISMANVGLGITFIPESGMVEDKNIIYFYIKDKKFHFPLIIIYKPNKYNGSIKKFIDFVKENYDNLSK